MPTLVRMKYVIRAVALLLLMASCSKNDEPGNGFCYTADSYYVFAQGGGKLILPNAFTPNSDGRNDLFRPIGAAGIATYSLSILDMNGNSIYHSADPFDFGWDGRYYSGIPAPEGKYAVYIQFKTVNGDVVDRNICLTLLDYGGGNCIYRSSTGNYYFEDQIDPSTGTVLYSTMETYCQ